MEGVSAVYSAGPPMAASRGTYSQLGWAAGRGDAVAGPNTNAKSWEGFLDKCQGVGAGPDGPSCARV